MTALTRRNLLKAGAAAVPAIALSAGPAHATTAGPLATGTVPASLAGFDKVVQTFMTERKISCGQLAMTKHGKLVMARGYGTYAPPTKAYILARVTPTSLFRIASLSKSITSAAIMRLVQDGKLSLGAPVTTLLGLSATADPRMDQVTVLRLMQHLGGWNRDTSKDPLWIDHTIAAALDVPLPIGHDDIIAYRNARPLDHDPGTRMYYSNYGYMLLGRIIAKVSGRSYEDYVKQAVLAPVGITRMRLGRSLRSEMSASEVSYTSKYTNKSVVDGSGQVVPFPYGGFNMPNQDANGGWIASAVDMVRYARIFDAAGPVLNANSLATIMAKPEIGESGDGWWYGCGWYARQVPGNLNTWHSGGMPGTHTYLARLQNGWTYSFLFNRREEEGSLDFDTLDDQMNRTPVNGSWPTTDLFPQYGF